jgi:hypothetical protein
VLNREGTDRNLDKSTNHFNLLARSRRREEADARRSPASIVV